MSSMRLTNLIEIRAAPGTAGEQCKPKKFILVISKASKSTYEDIKSMHKPLAWFVLLMKKMN